MSIEDPFKKGAVQEGGGKSSTFVETSSATPESISSAEMTLAKSRERLVQVLEAPDPEIASEDYASFQKRTRESWENAKFKAAAAFIGLSGATVFGSLLSIGVLEQAQATEALEFLQAYGASAVGTGMTAAFGVPLLLLGLEKLKQRKEGKKYESGNRATTA